MNFEWLRALGALFGVWQVVSALRVREPSKDLVNPYKCPSKPQGPFMLVPLRSGTIRSWSVSVPRFGQVFGFVDVG